jgi:hypothetical protein
MPQAMQPSVPALRGVPECDYSNSKFAHVGSHSSRRGDKNSKNGECAPAIIH